MKQVFGFWSLLSLKSLQSHAPNVTYLTPVRIKGYERLFSVWDPLGFTKTFPEISWIWFCALNLRESNYKDNGVNGVLFSVSDEEFDELKMREQEYDLFSTECFDFKTDVSLWECYFFSANKSESEYNYWCKAQEKYLEVCLDWAKSHGEEFYKEFLKTTFIWNENLENYV